MNGSTGKTIDEIVTNEKARRAGLDAKLANERAADAEIAEQHFRDVTSGKEQPRRVAALDAAALAAKYERERQAYAQSELDTEAKRAEFAADLQRTQLAQYAARLRRLAEYLSPVLDVALAGEGDPTVTVEHKMAACEWLLQQFEIANERIGNMRRFAQPPAAPLVHTKCHEPVEGAFVVWVVTDPKDTTSVQTIPITLDRRHYKLVPGPNFLAPDIADTTPLNSLVEGGHVKLLAPGARVPEMSEAEYRARRHAIVALGLEGGAS